MTNPPGRPRKSESTREWGIINFYSNEEFKNRDWLLFKKFVETDSSLETPTGKGKISACLRKLIVEYNRKRTLELEQVQNG